MFYCGPMKIEKLNKCNVSNAGIAQMCLKELQKDDNTAVTKLTFSLNYSKITDMPFPIIHSSVRCNDRRSF